MRGRIAGRGLMPRVSGRPITDRTCALDTNDFALLIVAASRGDLDAFRRLHGSAGPALLRVIHRICHDPLLVEHALQETLLTIWRGATGSIRAWRRPWLAVGGGARCGDRCDSAGAEAGRFV